MERTDSGRRFSRDVKLAAVQRMSAGANVAELAREIGVSRKGLYRWQKQFGDGGPSVLRGAGRPRREVPELSEPSDELSKTSARIAELERIVGQQTVDLDFFQQALQHVAGERQPNGAPGGTASTRSSGQ
jgi:transposase-like protein